MPQDERTDRPALGLICGSKCSLVVDAGISPSHTKEFMSHIEKLDVPSPKYVVITYFHWDHVFGTDI